jgi:hypothetical protein
MAQTDARAGFRLPWSSERSTSETTEIEQADAVATDVDAAVNEQPDAHAEPTTEWTTSAGDPAPTEPATVDEDAPVAIADRHANPSPVEESPAAPAAPSGGSRKPSKFLADLTKAMQAAAEESRSLTVAQFEGEAKAYIEQIHTRSSSEAADLRRRADDDVQAVREWSKAEIARIREETETRITTRKGQLEEEIEQHAAKVEREIAQVQARVSDFEQEMAAFFERLLQEDDPTRFATMAERLPEPPTFEEMSASTDYSAPLPTTAAVETTDDAADEAEAVADADAADGVADTEIAAAGHGEPTDADVTTEGDVLGEASVGELETTGVADGEAPDASASAERGATGDDVEIDREAAFAAIQAAAEAAASAEVASDAAARAEAVADIAIEIVGSHDDDGHEIDPRAAALGLPDFDAAEAEAFASAGQTDELEEIPEIGDEALAARIAGLTPVAGEPADPSAMKSTQLVVTGLVSVASIASFKRHLGRLAGVRSVGVSSGPDGEFLFAVSHAPDVVLRDAIPAMPSFQARVTSTGEGTLTVSAHDPESDN